MTEVLVFNTTTGLRGLEYNLSSQNNISHSVDIMEVNETIIGGPEDPDHENQYPLTAFLIQGLAITIVCALGLVGNVFSVVIFLRMRRKSSFTCFLLGLTSCDTVLVFTSILTWGLPAVFDYLETAEFFTTIVHAYVVVYVYPIAATGSAYFTVVVTIERYFAVCHPLESRSSRTWRRGLYISTAVVMLSFMFNISRWMEYNITPMMEGSQMAYSQTKLRLDPAYTKYYIYYAYLIINFCFPMITLMFFNCIIYRQICQSNRERHNLSPTQTSENSLALMLVVAVVVFLLCNILPLVNNMMEQYCEDIYRPSVYLGNFTICLNSSVNVLIYYAFGERFRRYFKATYNEIIHCISDHCCMLCGRSMAHTVRGPRMSTSESPNGSQKEESSVSRVSSFFRRKSKMQPF